MATTSPTRIDDDLYASAKLVGDVQSRSASQQLAHWARIGREIEASASVSHRQIAEVLAGRHPYDGLDVKEQAVVRAVWAERMAAYRDGLDLTKRFAAEGRTWVELDDDGRVVEHDPVSAGAGRARPRRATRAAGSKVETAKAPRTTGKASRPRRSSSNG